MRDITIVAQGGGMVTAYHAGVVRAISERFGFNRIKRVIASSGAATTYAYLVSGQTHLIEPIWFYLLQSGKFIDLWHHKMGHGVMDIDFLVDNAIREQYPLDISSLRESPIMFDIGVTETNTGCSRFFPKNTQLDLYELLRASCAVPYFYGRHVVLAGEQYCDGTIGDVVGLSQIGNDSKVLVILTRPDCPLKKFLLVRRALRWLLIRNEPLALQEKIWSMPIEYNSLTQHIAAFSKGKSVFVIRPQQQLPMWRIDTRVSRLMATIERGYHDIMSAIGLDGWWNSG
jgi:predicted patatin/cPLA2 family phospholipase